MIKATIGEAELYVVEVLSAQQSETLGKIAQLKIRVPLLNLPRNYFERMRKEKVHVYYFGKLVFSGTIEKNPELSFAANVSTVDLVIQDVSAELSSYHALIRNGYYLNKNIGTEVLPTLLTETNWTLDLSTYPTGKTYANKTIDLRGKKNRMEQIQALMQSVPSLYMRVNPAQEEPYVLEMGELGAPTVYISKSNILSISTNRGEKDAYSYIVPYGGKVGKYTLTMLYGDTNPYYLSSELRDRYVVRKLGEEWIVEDTEAGIFAGSSETFQNVKANNNTDANLIKVGDPIWNQAQYSLYTSAVAWLQRRSASLTYKVTALLEKKPKVGDKARLQLQISQRITNSFGTETTIPYLDVDELLLITRVGFEYTAQFESTEIYGSGDSRMLEYDMSLSAGVLEESAYEEIANETDNASNFDSDDVAASLQRLTQTVSFNSSMSANAPICNSTGLLIEPLNPTIPSGADSVTIYAVVKTLSGSNYVGATITNKIVPTLAQMQAGTKYQACISISGGWSGSFAAGYVEVSYVFQI